MKVIHSEITLQNLSGKYVAALRLHIWSENQVIVIDYVFGSYEARIATLKEVTDDARNQYIKTLNEFAGEDHLGPFANREELREVLQDCVPSTGFHTGPFLNGFVDAKEKIWNAVSNLFDEKEKQS